MQKIILIAWMILHSQGSYAAFGCGLTNNWLWWCDDDKPAKVTNDDDPFKGVATSGQSGGNNSQQTGRDNNSTNVTAKEINAEKVQVGGESKVTKGDDNSTNLKAEKIEADTIDMSKNDVSGDQIKGENVTVNKGASVKKMNFEDNILTVELDDGQQVRAVIPDPDLVKKLESLDVDALNSLDVEALKEISKLDTARLRDLTSSSTSLTEISKLDVTKLTELSKLDPEKLKGEKGDKGDTGQAGIGVAGQDGRDGRDGQDGLTPDTTIYALKSELPIEYLTESDLSGYALLDHLHSMDDVSSLTGNLAALVHTHPYATNAHAHNWVDISSRPDENLYALVADLHDAIHTHTASEIEYVGLNTITTVQEAIRSLPANRSSVDSFSNVFINVVSSSPDTFVGTLLPDVSMTGLMDAVCTVDHISLTPPLAGRGHDILLKVNSVQVGVTHYKQPGQTAIFTITGLDLTNGIEVYATIRLHTDYNVSHDPTFDAECTFTQGL